MQFVLPCIKDIELFLLTGVFSIRVVVISVCSIRILYTKMHKKKLQFFP